MDKNPFTEPLAAVVRARAAVLQLSGAELARRTGIPPQSMHRYMTGQREIPMSAFVKIAGALGVEAGDLIREAMGASS